MFVNSVSSTPNSFGAKLLGYDIRSLKKASIDAGLPERVYKKGMAKIHEYFPSNENEIRITHQAIPSPYAGVKNYRKKIGVYKNGTLLGERFMSHLPDGKYVLVQYLSALRKIAESLR